MARSITNKLKKLLFEQNMSQKDLANITGITESAISHYIKGDRVPRGVNLIKIAKGLGTTVDDLLSEDIKCDKESDMRTIKTLIARNAEMMTKEDKMELLEILIKED